MDLGRASGARTIADRVAQTATTVLASERGGMSVTIEWIATIGIGAMMARVITSQAASSTRIVTIVAAGKPRVVGLNAMVAMTAQMVTRCEAVMIANQVESVAVRLMGVVQIAMIGLRCVAIAVGNGMIAIGRMTWQNVRVAAVVTWIVVDTAKAGTNAVGPAGLKARAVQAADVDSEKNSHLGVARAVRDLSTAGKVNAVLVVTALHGVHGVHGVREAAVNEAKHSAALKTCIGGTGRENYTVVQVAGLRHSVRAARVI